MKSPRKLILYSPNIIAIPLTRNFYAFIDSEDAEEVGKYNWHVDLHKHTNYAARGYRIGNKIYNQSLHQFLYIQWNCPAPNEIDHIDHNGLNNRRNNLRICTNSQNGGNRLIGCNNSTGYKGVFWHKGHQKFRADLKLNGKRKTIGYFQSAKEAAIAYNITAIKAFGDFANLNKID